MIDNETCDVVDYDGYVQPTCEPLESTANRTPFAVSFTPDPACNRWEVLCASQGLDAILVVGGGSGYTPGSNPAVTIIGGGGAGATATATVDGTGAVVSIVVDSAGSGYTSAPTITIAPPPSGTTATATATLQDCTGITMHDCSAVGPEISAPVPVGQSVYVCSENAPSGFPGEYTVTEDGKCLCDCINVDLSNTGPSGDLIVVYIDCITQTQIRVTIPPGSGLNDICIVNGSLTYTETEQAVFNQVINGTCDGDGI
jgi:hypothetical protein